VIVYYSLEASIRRDVTWPSIDMYFILRGGGEFLAAWWPGLLQDTIIPFRPGGGVLFFISALL